MYVANITMGFLQKEFEGESAIEIVDKAYKYQDFDCLIRMGKDQGTAKDKKEIIKLEKFIEKYYSEELTFDDIKKLNINLSIGNIVCTELKKV